jgi:hypothetical protein
MREYRFYVYILQGNSPTTSTPGRRLYLGAFETVTRSRGSRGATKRLDKRKEA